MKQKLRRCKCGAPLYKITGGGEYFKKLRKAIWQCTRKICQFKKTVRLEFK